MNEEIKEWQTQSVKHKVAYVLMMDGISFRYTEETGIVFSAPDFYVKNLIRPSSIHKPLYASRSVSAILLFLRSFSLSAKIRYSRSFFVYLAVRSLLNTMQRYSILYYKQNF